ncbi:MAG: hypothetical protein RLN76_11295 [Phycisphaeraceae bacterium]
MERDGNHLHIKLAIQIKKLDGKRLILGPDGQDLFQPAQPKPQPHLVLALGQAYNWKQKLESTGCTLAALAKELGITERRIRELLPLTLLGPKLVKRILTGNHGSTITLDRLLATATHLDWQRQLAFLGMDESVRTTP